MEMLSTIVGGTTQIPHRPLQYAPPPHPQYASSSQSQPLQSTSPMEQAILNLTKLVGDFVEEQKTFNAQLSQRIHTVENSLDQKLDGLQSEVGQKFDNLQGEIDQQFDNLQCSISRLTNQHIHQKEGSPEEECLSDTMVEEQCQQQLQEGLIENFESSAISADVCPWEKTSPMLTEEGSRKEEMVEPQKPTAQATNSPLPEAPSPDLVHTLPAAQPLSEEHAPAAEAKVIPSPLPIVQNFRKLVAAAQIFATTSKKLSATHTVWHNGWFGCWFRCGAPGLQHIYKLH